MARTYRMTEEHLDHLMTLSGDQLISIIARLTDRTVGILSVFYGDKEIPHHTQEIFQLQVHLGV